MNPLSGRILVVTTKTIPMGQLMLDLENPRYGKVRSQSEAMTAIINHQGPKLVALAEHIGLLGTNPADIPLVMAKGKNYIVLEGNRRLAAIRLLDRPQLAKDTGYVKAFEALADQFHSPTEIDCSIMADRDEARPWILLRHAGESGGIGPVPWGVAERERFAPRPGTQAFQALAFIEAAKAAYPDHSELQANLDKIRDERPSTLGRLLSNSEFKRRFGSTDAQGRFIARFPAAVVQQLVEQLAEDFAHHIGVSQVKTKPQQDDYIKALEQPDESTALDVPAPLDDTRVSNSGSKGGAGGKRGKREPKAEPLMKRLDLCNFSKRTNDIVREARRLEPARYPNAAALMVRAVLELAVDEHYEKRGWKIRDKFAIRVRKCLHEVDPTDKDHKWQPIRTGLQDASSLHSVSTLHGFVHNPSYHPTEGDVRNITANWEPFLQALNDLA